MITYHAGVQADVSEDRLPADAVPAIGAYSLNRKLRKLYSGNYFQFRQGTQTKEYPAQQIDPNQDAYLVKVYDQKARHGVPTADAVQNDTALQPLVYKDGNEIKADFNQSEYLEISGLAEHVGTNFTITARGDGGDLPRPMFGLWGNDEVTLEPSDLATRFTYNNNLGTIAEADGLSIQCFSGLDASQNGKRVISVNGEQSGFVESSTASSDFENASIGKSRNRLYKGSFSEITIHSGDLTKLGAQQLFTTMKDYYGN